MPKSKLQNKIQSRKSKYTWKQSRQCHLGTIVPASLRSNHSSVTWDQLRLSPHPALRRHGNVATMSLCTSQRRRRYASNEKPNNVSMERRQDVSVVHLHNVLLKCWNDVSKGRSNEVPS